MSEQPIADPGARVQLLDRASISDAQLLEVLERADRLSAPRAEWYLVLGHAPEMAKGYEDFWNLTYRGGRVELAVKELMRLTITTLLGCSFCATQRPSEAAEEGLEEERMASCALPDFADPDPRIRAALRLARSLALDVAGNVDDWDDVYAELRASFDDAEVAELVCFCANTIGGALVTRTLRLPAA